MGCENDVDRHHVDVSSCSALPPFFFCLLMVTEDKPMNTTEANAANKR